VNGVGAEAISGLGHAFFYAGGRAFLVYNWPVHSDSAKDIITDVFHRRTADGTLSRAEALRRAMVVTIQWQASMAAGSPRYISLLLDDRNCDSISHRLILN